MTTKHVRVFRHPDHYSRKEDLMCDHREMIRKNRAANDNSVINANVEAFRAKFDLTYPEFYFWSHYIHDLEKSWLRPHRTFFMTSLSKVG